MKNYLFKVKVKHDNGIHNITTNVLANDNEVLKEIKERVKSKIQNFENCPLSAITKIQLIKINNII